MVGKAAMIVAEKVRRLSSLQRATAQSLTPNTTFECGLDADGSEFANELAQTRAELIERDKALIHANRWIEYLAERGAELERQVAQETPVPRVPEEDMNAPNDQSAATNKRATELESELATAREGFVLCKNENHVLQTSLNWIASENARLSRRVTELVTAVDEANEKRQTETNALNTLLEAMSTRALAAEKLLEEIRQSLLGGTKEKHAAEHWVVDRTSAPDIVDNKLRPIQNSLMIKLPVALVTPPDPKVDLAKIWEKLTSLDSRLQYELERHALAAATRERLRRNCAEPPGELTNVKHNGNHPERSEVRHTQMLLASILAS